MTDQMQDYTAWLDHQVNDNAGEKLGKVHSIYLDDETGQPEWIAVSTGMFSKKSSFVPMAGATADGDLLVVAYGKDQVKDAPQVEEDSDGHLEPDEETELYRYYGLQMAPEQAAAPARQDPQTAGGDDAMTRSEEHMVVGKRSQETGRARLRKYVVTEEVSQTVPVSHEEIRVEREPITDANRDKALDGAEITEAEYEVTLHEERAVAQKEVVPVERVRLSKETVAGEETVSDEIRKEQIVEEGVEGTTTPDAGR